MAPDTVRAHGSIDVLIVFRTTEVNQPTRKATPTTAIATGSNADMVLQHETAAALKAPVQNPDTTASEAGKGWP